MNRPSPDPDFLLRGCDGPVCSLAFRGEEDGKPTTLLTGTQDGTVYEWSLRTRRITHQMTAHTPHSVLWIRPWEDFLLTQGRDGTLDKWNTQTKEWTAYEIMPCGRLGFCSATTVQRGLETLVAVPSPDDQSQIDLVCVNSWTRVQKLLPSDSGPKQGMCMCVESCGENYVAVGYESGNVLLWDVRIQKEMSSVEMFPDAVMCLGYSDVKQKGVSGSAGNTLEMWQPLLTTLKKSKSEVVPNPGIACVQFRRDGRLFAAGGWDGRTRIFSHNFKPLAVLQLHTETVQAVQYAGDDTLAVGSKDGTISLWSLYK